MIRDATIAADSAKNVSGFSQVFRILGYNLERKISLVVRANEMKLTVITA